MAEFLQERAAYTTLHNWLSLMDYPILLKFVLLGFSNCFLLTQSILLFEEMQVCCNLLSDPLI